MIDLTEETVIPIGEAAHHLPKRRGKKIHISTLYRWATSGVRGVQLETILVGGSRCTSLEALQRFSQRLSEEEVREALPVRRTLQRARETEQTLRDAGI